jgi:DNA-binding transcriptional regulator PaaX
LNTWLHLLYKIPRNPSKVRVYVWRKLKRLGAVLLHESVWCLPSTSKTREQFQWLVVEIQDLGGEASLWETRSVFREQDETIIQEFLNQVDKEYEELLKALEDKEPDLLAISKKYQQVKIQDYFHSQLGERVHKELFERKGGRL